MKSKNQTMKQQDFKNHTRFAPKVYYLSLLLGLIVLIAASISIVTCDSSCNSQTSYWLFMGLSFAVVVAVLYSRMFALKAQDRAIRAEENLRHFALTGKLLDARLSISQIVALRFACDEEFVSLAQKAADGQLSSKDIKAEIKHWKADWYRV
jgi:FtsH-binding integral membrane protein